MTYALKPQNRLAGPALRASPHRITFDPSRLNDIKAAITKTDIRLLIAEGAISAVPVRGVSRARARKSAQQRAKGLRKGPGSREGKATARNPAKREWTAKVRAQRAFLIGLREKNILTPDTYRDLYRKSKGGFFRSVRHIKIFINEREMVTRAAKEHVAPKKKE